ncbi:hypothetical protein ASE27_15540 [Oerskovia sp. Root918]|uniref:hypothetical protein n=1 Tax=Oerskovia sp. Root918 TaxID=1736607 RepID=UPI0007010588|nr:hypothetical protein [Oerskovia sp. Root918]KRD35210.1 hypothetical protein ASE27_15540 [Oerskovia sp. Root918]
MSEGGLQFKMVVMQWGSIPPSGGPNRERYLDHYGRESMQAADDEYDAVLMILGDRAKEVPTLDFELVEEDEDAARVIQRQKREEWEQFGATIDQATLNAIEPHITKSTTSAVAALNYLEDHELKEIAHLAIHRAAFVNRGLFGCPVVWRDEAYWTDCPIDVSHLRVGVSGGLVSDFACSICARLVEDCDHQMGEPHPKVAESKDGECSICAATECEHVAGESYLVVAYASAINVVAQEVSFVARPRYPQARIIEMTKDLGEIGDRPRVRAAAEQGLLNCDADLGPCKGFNEMQNWK